MGFANPVPFSTSDQTIRSARRKIEAVKPIQSRKSKKSASKAVRKPAKSKSAKSQTEFYTAEDIQAAWRRENDSQRPKSSKSAINSQRGLRDRRKASPPAKAKRPIEMVTAPALAKIPWLIHGFSTRPGGVTPEYGGDQLNLGYTAQDTQANVHLNRELFIRALGATTKSKPWPLVNLSQIHSGIVQNVTRDFASKTTTVRSGDGLITNIPGLVIAVKVADCLPVIAVDRKRRVVGVFHAGWRGTVQRIVEKGIGEMRRQHHSDPRDIVAVIGPSIGKCCYEIGEEVESEFQSQFAYAPELFEDVFDSWSLHTRYPLLFLNQRAPGHGEPALSRHLDLVKANRYQLRDAGVPEANINSLDLCTHCRTDLFFSHRKEQITGRMMAAVAIKP
jgi:YfiH family protein